MNPKMPPNVSAVVMHRRWSKDEPPSIGWWNASTSRRPDLWRFWNGKTWSMAVKEGTASEHAAVMARRTTIHSKDMIEWSDYWPPGAPPRPFVGRK